MRYRRFGKTGMYLSELGLGCGFRDGVNEGSRQVIEKALDLGVNYLDTAEGYGSSEELIGKVLSSRKEGDDIFIATKISPNNLHYDEVLKSAQKSLGRLGRKTIDLYQLHGWNPNIPIRETMDAMERLIHEGTVRYIGLGTSNVAQIKEAQESLPKSEIVSDLYHYNMLDREVEEQILPFCETNNIMLVAYSPLAAGILTEKARESESRKRLAIVPQETWLTRFVDQKNVGTTISLLEKLSELGKRRQKTVSQIALNWLLSKQNVMPIPTTSIATEIEEDIAASGWSLTSDELSSIGTILSQGTAKLGGDEAGPIERAD